MSRVRVGWLLGGLWLALALSVAAVPGQFSDELDAGDYNCLLMLEPAAHLGARAAVRLVLEAGGGAPAVRVAITRQQITVTGRARRALAAFPSGVVPGAPCQLTVLRRGERIALLRDEHLLGSVAVPRGGGTQAGIDADTGWRVADTRIQRIEPVVFSDDFMRDAGDATPWVTVSGRWRQQSAWETAPTLHGADKQAILDASRDAATSRGQNPFAWVGCSAGQEGRPAGQEGQPAVCTTGNPFWEDYTFSVAVNPARDGACGLLCNVADGAGLLVRWTPANDRAPGGNALSLCRYDLKTGVRTVLASDPGGFMPGQWYRLAVVSTLDGVRVLVDGQERLAAPVATPWRGAVGLYAEGETGATFDDVAVYGRALNADLLLEQQQQQITQRFVEDRGGMQDWAVGPKEWLAGDAQCRWYRQELYGDQCWLVMTVHPPAKSSGELALTLAGDGQRAVAGYRAVLKLTADPAKLSCALYRDTAVLAEQAMPALAPGVDYVLRFRRSGRALRLEIDGDTVLTAADPAPLTGTRAGYRTDGAAFAGARDIQAIGYNTLDYPFTEAPVDWRAQGTWEPTIRWSCTPAWSFLAGRSRGEAALWQKRRFTGDQAFEAYVSTKMDYPRETDTYFNRQGYFAVTLCGDGRNPRNGYAGVYGYPGEDGTPLARAVLLRNGVVVAATPVTRRSWASNHRMWFYLQLKKHGATVDFTARIDQENYALSFTDPQPIAGGVPALWTFNNAMTVARARLDFANPPAPAPGAPVVIADPWYPEWANQDALLNLDLSASWSASGKPLAWKVTPAEVPAGDEKAVAVSDAGKLAFLPKKSGKHWYRVAALDGADASQDFHLSLPVFTPALGRDDTHALVLYRFDEGSGNIVHDRSSIAPALDLALTPDPQNCRWLPGQGLTQRGGVQTLATTAPADKLLAIKKRWACTLECWASAESLFGPYARANCFCSWEPVLHGETAKPYLGFTAGQDYFQLAPGGVDFQNLFPGFQTSLHHVVYTWDTLTTTIYFDGVKVGESQLLWDPSKWASGAKLYVGGQQTGARTLIGQLYLLAIHDRCFTPEEVLRHYKAGPSAK